MKHWTLTFLLIFVSLGAWAQYAVPNAEFKRSGAGIKMDGEKLSKEACNELLLNAGGEELYGQWEKAKDWRTAGIVMTSAGSVVGLAGGFCFRVGALTSGLGAVFGAGAAAVIVTPIGGEEAGHEAANQAAQNGAQAGVPFMIGGMVAAGLGFGTMIAGIPILVVNCKKMNQVVDGLNDSRTVTQFGFGATGNGAGLYLRF